MGNTFGHLFRLSTFGESHGPAVGGLIDGCPAGVEVDYGLIDRMLQARRPGGNSCQSPREESDTVEFLSGISEGKTLGTPIAFLIRNRDARSSDYEALRDVFRPSHADYTYFAKYGLRDHRGGGRASARETVARVVGGAFAMMLLRPLGIRIEAFTTAVGSIGCGSDFFSNQASAAGSGPRDIFEGDDSYSAEAQGNILHCPDAVLARKMGDELQSLRQQGDTVGAAVRCLVRGVPAGWGAPVFDKLEACLAAAMLSIPACKGFSYGSGFDLSRRGSEMNDAFCPSEDDSRRLKTKSRFSGGIQGGISNGEDIDFLLAFKALSGISREQESVDTEGRPCTLRIQGRHDVCAVPRVLPVVEAMTALCLADAMLMSQSDRIDCFINHA